MPRFFIEREMISESGISLSGNDAIHITKALRMRPGERLTVCDGCGTEYETEIAATGPSVLLNVISAKRCESEPPYRAYVYQALVKGDRFDTVIQKSVELGAYAIVPVVTSRCMMKIDRKDEAHKLERWRAIAREAAGQCGRGIVPDVKGIMTFREAVSDAAETSLPLFCYEGGDTKPLPDVMKDSIETAAVMIGPEGGWAPDEAEYASANGMISVGLGKRILRTETAAPAVLACLSYKYEL